MSFNEKVETSEQIAEKAMGILAKLHISHLKVALEYQT